ncbi:hypothetical protein [Nocardia fluminea]|uniref:hypothetical protein n=1 Tax=Nocardia fluminea TaxID=134984 RepID=UPI0033FE0476
MTAQLVVDVEVSTAAEVIGATTRAFADAVFAHGALVTLIEHRAGSRSRDRRAVVSGAHSPAHAVHGVSRTAAGRRRHRPVRATESRTSE